MRKSVNGFTIVELLIVIVVIGILASISVVAYTGIQARAQAAAIVSGINATEKAFNIYRAVSGTGNWWRETDANLRSGASDSSIANIIANNPDFADYLQEAPSAEGLGTSSQWAYDNDGDTYNGCSAASSGVGIYVAGVTDTDVALAVDDAIDDGNLSCGKMRLWTTSNRLIYSLANNENQ